MRAAVTGARWAAAAVGLGLVAVTAALVLADAGPASTLRHAYLVPVIAAGLRFGVTGGWLAGAAAVVLEAPFVLPAVERGGLGPATAEGLVSLAVLLVLGGVSGTLATEARRQRFRYETLLALQRALAGEAPLETALDRARACLAERLATPVALVVMEDAGLCLSGAVAVAPGSAAARALQTGEPLYVPAAGCEARPRRAFLAPLRARGQHLGVLAVERVGEIDGHERATLAALAVYLGLGLENARLAARQRRFAGELAEAIACVAQAKAAFVATASHELRTPLTALLGFAELLTVRDLPPPEVRRLAEIVRRETERLARIVDDLLDLSRLEGGLDVRLRRGTVAVAPLVAAAADLFRRPGSGHRLIVDCADDLPPLHADPDAVDRVLKNLLSNALKYSPPGTTVRIGARRAGATAVEIAVEDQGRGIPPEALPRIFEPYYRAPGVAASARGTGLGLAVVKALVDAHGGSIAVESAPATGTRVRVLLPALP